MDFSYTAEEEAFRKEVSDWFDEAMKEVPKWYTDPNVLGPDTDSKEYHDFGIWWHQKMYDAGYVGMHWPKEYGGRSATLIEQMIVNEEMARHNAPPATNGIGIGWCGPTIMAAGTEEQRQRFLKPMLRAEEYWAQGFSEPGAGSDLASISTRAVEDGDDFVVNGQKVWTSGSTRSDWAVLMVRTDPNAPKHRGITYLLLDLHSPGVTVRPLVQIHGTAGYGEVFLDDVRIPKKYMVGELNRGWYVAMATLEWERSGVGASVQRLRTIEDIIKIAKSMKRHGKPLTADPVVRNKLAQFYVEANAIKYTGLRAATRQLRGERPGPEGVVGHVFNAEYSKRLQHYVMDLLGPYSQLVRGAKNAYEHGRWGRSFLAAPGGSIATGTSEINRNVVAQRVLGLPR